MAAENTVQGKPGGAGASSSTSGVISSPSSSTSGVISSVANSGIISTGAASAPRFEAAGVKLFRRDQASSYGWWGNLAVVLGRQPPGAEHVASYRECVIELHKQHPRGVGLITVVNDTSTPSAAGREAMIKMFKEIWPLMTAALFVPNAEGFKAAVLRSVMGGLILATGQRDRVRVARSLDEGLPWFLHKVMGDDDARRQQQHLQWGIEKFCEAETDGQ